MLYNNLGKSGLKVSEVSFGSWLTFGSNLDLSAVKMMLKQAYEMGINFFDNAEVYAQGQSEILMGQALKDFKREELVISTKIFWGGEGPNDTGLSWKHLVEGTNNSLKRLQLEYVDLLFCHRPDPGTPIEETVRAMDVLIRQGKAFYWGTSEWSASQIEQAFTLAKDCHCIPPTMEQPQYSMLVRKRFEQEYQSLFERYRLGTTIWSPLASGILSGKYNQGIPAGSRLEKVDWLRDKLTPQVVEKVKNLSLVAKKLDCSLAQLAIAWCLKNPHVSTVILGASNSQQLKENVAAVDLKAKIDDPIMSEINKILGPVSA